MLLVIVLRKSPKPEDNPPDTAPSIGLPFLKILFKAPLTPAPAIFDPVLPNISDKPPVTFSYAIS